MIPNLCSHQRLGRPLGILIASAAALLTMPAPAGADAAAGTITTIAAKLAQPRTAAVAANGDIYFTDTYHHQIGRVDASGRVTTIAGNGYAGSGGDGGPATEASLDTPHGVAVDNRGHVYIADSPNHRIRRVDLADGSIRTIAGTGAEGYGGDGGPATAAKLNRPRFLVVAADGSLIVADTGNYRVRRIDPSGVITTIAGTGEKGYSGDGGPATAARFDDPRGLAFDGAGNLYVSNAEGSPVPAVRRIDRAGTITTVAGGKPKGFSGDGGPATEARLNEPRSIAISGSTLYIADSINDRIRAVDLRTGIIRTVAGTGSATFRGDGGPAAQAAVAEPRGVAVTHDGDVIVADTGNDRLRRIDVAGAVSAGGPAAPPPPQAGGAAPTTTSTTAPGKVTTTTARPATTTTRPVAATTTTTPSPSPSPSPELPAAPIPAATEPAVAGDFGVLTAPEMVTFGVFGDGIGGIRATPLRLWDLASSAR